MSGLSGSQSASEKTVFYFLILFQRSIGLPDVHSGYGFAIGNMAAFDMNDPEAVVSPGKVTVHVCCQVCSFSQNRSLSKIEHGCTWCVNVSLIIFCHFFSPFTERINCGHSEAIKIPSKAYIYLKLFGLLLCARHYSDMAYKRN